MLGYPSVLGVVGSFIDTLPKGLSDAVMNWKQIKEISGKKLVEVVSHSYDLHKEYSIILPEMLVQQPHSFPIAPRKRHTRQKRHIAQIARDFETQKALFLEHLGFAPKAIIWPYGWYTSISQMVRQKPDARWASQRSRVCRCKEYCEYQSRICQKQTHRRFHPPDQKPDAGKITDAGRPGRPDLIYDRPTKRWMKTLGS